MIWVWIKRWSILHFADNPNTDYKTEHFYCEPLPHCLLSDPWAALIYAQLIWLCSFSIVALFPASWLCVGARLERGILSPPASQRAQLRPWQCPRGHMAKCGILLITTAWWSLAIVAVLVIFICPAVSKCIIHMLTFKRRCQIGGPPQSPSSHYILYSKTWSLVDSMGSSLADSLIINFIILNSVFQKWLFLWFITLTFMCII